MSLECIMFQETRQMSHDLTYMWNLEKKTGQVEILKSDDH